jgi:hypothetical protein
MRVSRVSFGAIGTVVGDGFTLVVISQTDRDAQPLRTTTT